jgi:hypothetical protein
LERGIESVETRLGDEGGLIDELGIGALFGGDAGGAPANAEVDVVSAVDDADWLLEVEEARPSGFAAEVVGGGVVVAENDVVSGCEL